MNFCHGTRCEPGRFAVRTKFARFVTTDRLDGATIVPDSGGVSVGCYFLSQLLEGRRGHFPVAFGQTGQFGLDLFSETRKPSFDLEVLWFVPGLGGARDQRIFGLLDRQSRMNFFLTDEID